MSVDTICVLVSGLSFYAYAFSYFISTHMKSEFRRFNLEKVGPLIIGLEFLGATGLLVGLKFSLILMISSLGLGTLMLCGLIVRITVKDSIWISLPVIFFMFLNVYIFLTTIR